MRISAETMAVLKSFATINQGIRFKPGNVISTISPLKNIMVNATITETIPQEFRIYDLNKFLSVVSLYKEDFELGFDDVNVLIKGLGGRSKIKYRMATPDMIVAAPDKCPTIPSVDVSFVLSEEDFKWIIRSANILSSTHLMIESDGEEVNMTACNINDDSADTNSVILPVETDKKYKLIFKVENLKMIPRTYNVEISSKGVAKFYTNNSDLVYFITLETASHYE